MATNRKPVPRFSMTPDPEKRLSDQNGNTGRTAAMGNIPAGTQITRYSLTDAPVISEQHPHSQPPMVEGESYDTIAHAVDQILQKRHSALPLQSRPDLHSVANDDAQMQKDTLPSSGLTFMGQPGFHYKEAQHQNGGNDSIDHSYYRKEETFQPGTRGIPQEHPQSVEYLPYQPGQFLATINTGESLHWEDISQRTHMEPSRDPFSDPRAPSIGPPQDYMYVQPDYPQGNSQLPSRSGTSHSHHQPFNAQTPEPNADHYQSQGLAVHSVGGDPVVDHFRHDPEAYASGVQSRASFHPPRSRSPTPGFDNERYDINGTENMDYANYLRHSDSPVYDPEKQMDQETNFQNGYPYGEGIPYEHNDTENDIASQPFLDPGSPVEETRHFGPAPAGRAVRRHKTKKRVQLTNGNLVMSLDVPPKLLLPRKGIPEMMKTRYTAVTCDPDEFEAKGFILRQNESRRKTELFIVVTMYNEDEIALCRTLYGIMRNISYLCTRKNSQTWGPDAWEKVVVCIVADGRKKVHPRVLDCLTLLGVYQPGGHMKSFVNNKEVTAHLFEYTTSFALDPNLHFKYPDKGVVPTQIIFCIKEKNQRKINSHRWFFNAFAPLLQPNVCVLLDVGTRPGTTSIYRLWKVFDLNSNVGGACGEIAAYKGKKWELLLNPLVAAQNFEYKMSCILDKPTESLFGYISVLPGAFSALRYIALQNDKMTGRGPLASYFKGEVLHGRDTDIFTSNMYLAEDRILCFELVAKMNSNWVLKYVKGAIGETDVPEALPEFIVQRRRWLNGSFFAATYAIAHVGQILQSGHSFIRKVMLMLETIYNIINLVFAWFSIGNFYLFFVILTSSLEDPAFEMTGIKYFNSVVQYFMASVVVACFLFSMGNKPYASKWKYKLTAIFLGTLMVYMIFASTKCAIKAASQGGTANNIMLLSVIVTFGLYFFSSFLAFDPWHLLTSLVPYMLLVPTYINILNIYAFSNLDDISWGTKQDSTVETDLGAVIQDNQSQVHVEMFAEAADIDGIYEEALFNLKNRMPAPPRTNAILSMLEKEQAAKDYYASVRTNVLLLWVLSNGLLLAAILGGAQPENTFTADAKLDRTKVYLICILAFSAIQSSIRFAGSTLYLLASIIVG